MTRIATAARRPARLRLEALETRDNPVVGSTIQVTTLADSGPGSLREAIATANNETTNPGPDTIIFGQMTAGGTIALTTADANTTLGPSGLVVTSTIDIQGTGQTITRGNTPTAFRLFAVTTAGNLTLDSLTLSNGLARGGAGGVSGGGGSGMAATGVGGGGGGAGLGGAIYNRGTLQISNSTLTANVAAGGSAGGVGIGGSGVVGGGGGGLNGPGDAAGNGGGPGGGTAGTAGTVGAGSMGGSGTAGGVGGGGGAGGNGADSSTGMPVTSAGSGGNGGVGGFGGGGGAGGGRGAGTDFVSSGTGGQGGFGGGGGGTGYGGGIDNAAPGGFGGGRSGTGVTTVGGGGAGLGGAVFNQGGRVTIRTSTIAANVAVGGSTGAAQSGGAFGGGVFNLNGGVILTDNTFADNRVVFGQQGTLPGDTGGGAVYNLALTIGVMGAPPVATLSLAGNIFANSLGNSAPNPTTFVPTANVVNNQSSGFAAITATGPNLDSFGSTSYGVANGTGNSAGMFSGTAITVADPLLAPLGSYSTGNPFRTAPTYALLPGSPAIDAGDPMDTSFDQRDVPVQFGRRDLGAFESRGFTIAVTSGNNQSAAINTAFGQPLVATVTPLDPGVPSVGGTVRFGAVTAMASATPGSQPATSIVNDGTFRTTATANGTTGTYQVTANPVTGLVGPPATFTLTNTAAGTPPSGGGGTTTTPPATGGGGGTSTPAPASSTTLTATPTPGGNGADLTVRNSDGSERFKLSAFGGTFPGRVSIAIGDLDGDGVDDVIVGAGAGGGPRIQTFDGATGKLTADYFAFDPRFRGGVNVAAANGMVVAGAGVGGGPRVRVFENGTAIADFFAFDPDARTGVTVATGDVNNDGVSDVIVGAGPGGGPVVRVFDGDTGAALANYFVSPNPNDRTGVRVAVRDLDRNGANEVVARVAGVTRVFAPLDPAGREITGDFGATAVDGVFVG